MIMIKNGDICPIRLIEDESADDLKKKAEEILKDKKAKEKNKNKA